jgi:hypothetical protein
MSFEYLKHFLGEAHIIMVEIGALILGALTLIRWIWKDIDALKGTKDKK